MANSGDAFFDAAWKGIVLLVAAWVSTKLMNRASASARHFVWVAFTAGVLVLPVSSATLPKWHVLPEWLQSVRLADAPLEQTGFIGKVPAGMEGHGVAYNFAEHRDTVSANDVATGSKNSVEEIAGSNTTPSESLVVKPAVGGPTNYSLRPLLAMVWFTGSSIVLVRIALGTISLWLFARRSEVITVGPLRQVIDGVCQQLKVRRHITLLQGSDRSMPLTWGILRPCVLFPVDASTWSQERCRVVLVHEVGHIKRLDFVGQLLGQAACVLYWFNPMVWVAASQIATERESACDDLVLGTGLHASEYAEHLVDVVSKLRPDTGSAYAAIGMARDSQLERRIRSILDNSRNRGVLTWQVSLSGGFLAFCLVYIPVAMLGVTGLNNAAVAEPEERATVALNNNQGQAVDLYGDELPDGAAARFGSIRFRHGDDVEGIAFTHDGGSVISAANGGICYWSVNDGKLIRTIDVGSQSLQAFAVSPDGQIAISVGPDNEQYIRHIKFWNVDSGKEIATNEFSGDTDRVRIASSSDGNTVFIGSSDGLIRIWSRDQNKEIFSRKIGEGRIESLSLSPDEKTLAVAGSHQKVYLWAWNEEKEAILFSVPSRQPSWVAFSPDGSSLAVADGSGKVGVHIVEVPSGKVIRTLTDGNGSNYISRVLFSPNGQMLVAWCYRTNQFVVWDSDTGQPLGKLNPSPVDMMNMAISRDGSVLAASGSSGEVSLWDLPTLKRRMNEFVSHRASVDQLALSVDGRMVATASDDGTARLWDTESGRQKQVVRHDRWVRAVALSSDGNVVATSSLDDTVRLWDTKSGKELFRLKGHGKAGGTRALAFTRDGKRLVSWGDDIYLRVWDVSTGELQIEHRVHPTGVKLPGDNDTSEAAAMQKLELHALRPAIFSGDVSHLVVGGRSSIYVFDVQSGKELRKLQQRDGHLISMMVSPDNNYFLTSAFGQPSYPMKHVLRLRSLKTGDDVHSIDFPNEFPGAVAFSHDAKAFAAANRSPQPKIRLLDVGTGKILATLDGFRSGATSMAFSSTDNRLATGMRDGTGLIWDLSRIMKRENVQAEDSGTPLVAKTEETAELEMDTYSANRLKELAKTNQTVMVLFAADYCPVCRRVRHDVLGSDDVRTIVSTNRVVPLLADLTDNQNDQSKETLDILESLGSKSTPTVVIYPASAPDDPLVLHESITKQQLIEALTAAGPSKGNR